MLYRQIFLKQDYRDFEDIAIIVTLNALLFVIGVLWKGGISFRTFRYTSMAILYGTILLLGSLLGIILGRFDSWETYLPYLGRSRRCFSDPVAHLRHCCPSGKSQTE